ncbi:hypothetical protein CAS74_002269 [Pichia kudriavzevii]|uniref:N-acetyltransferase domain-containing protein n=1 Tax=Pichia kudriavzevii TaxID=4909 RepID=A0A1Z8JPR4_PICKU|nr:hypothetical protein CAS74_002269 [Pichia kudriavzevii]
MFSALNSYFKKDSTCNPPTTASVNESLTVEVLSIKDYKKAARTLQIAFQDDLYVNYLTSGLSDTTTKEQLDLALFEATAYSTIMNGLLVAVRDREAEESDPQAPFLAVACFQKPEKDEKSSTSRSLFSHLWTMYQTGYLKFVYLANKETRRRVFDEQWKLLDQLKEEVLGDQLNKSWYLSDIGAIPKGRGQGLARKLVEFVCHNYIDRYIVEKDTNGDDDDDDEEIINSGDDRYIGSSDENSRLDSEINSFHFQFDLDSDNITDYSGYSSFSDTESAHSSWYNKEHSNSNTDNEDGDDDILSKYDRQQSMKYRNRRGAPLYLESSHPRNRKIYQKLGFTYVKTVPVAEVQLGKENKKVLTMDLMVRGVKGTKWKVENVFN